MLPPAGNFDLPHVWLSRHWVPVILASFGFHTKNCRVFRLTSRAIRSSSSNTNLANNSPASQLQSSLSNFCSYSWVIGLYQEIICFMVTVSVKMWLIFCIADVPVNAKYGGGWGANAGGPSNTQQTVIAVSSSQVSNARRITTTRRSRRPLGPSSGPVKEQGALMEAATIMAQGQITKGDDEPISMGMTFVSLWFTHCPWFCSCI